MDIGFPSAWLLGRVNGIQGTQISLFSVAFLLSLWLLMEGEEKEESHREICRGCSGEEDKGDMEDVSVYLLL